MTDSEVAWLKPEQVEAMRDVAHEGRNGHRDEAIVTLLYDTGLRRAEAAALDVDLLDLDDGTLFVPGPIQKDYPNDNSPPPVTIELDQSGDLRTVRTLRSFLSSRDSGPALWPGRSSDRLTPKAINNVVKRLAKNAEVRPHLQVGRGQPADVSAHTLRHSVAYRMLRVEEDRDIYDVKNRLRHASLATTDRKYAHLDTV